MAGIRPARWLTSAAIACALALPSRADEPVAVSTQPVALQDVLSQALASNTDILVERLSHRIAQAEEAKARSAFDPQASLSLNDKRTRSPLSTAVDGPQAASSEIQTVDLTIKKRWITGADTRLSLAATRTDDPLKGPILNPYYNGDTNLTLSQPLLKGAGVFVNRSSLVIAQKDARASRARFEQLVMNTLRDAENAYWDLYLQWNNLDAQKKSLDSAQRLQEMYRRMAALQAISRVDLLETEKEVASRRESLLKAWEQVVQNGAQLKGLMNFNEEPRGQEPDLFPSETPKFREAEFLLDEEVERALLNRRDFQAAKLNVESHEIRVRVARNALLPALSLTAGAGTNALSGKNRPLTDALGNPVISPFAGGADDLADRLLKEDYYQWNIGVTLEFPTTFREARADREQKEAAAAQALAQLIRTERTVIREVRTALKLIEITRRRVQESREASRLAEQQLQDGERQLQLGATNTTRVILFLDGLTTARLRENDALVSYVKALVELERATGVFLPARGIELK